MPKKDAEDGTLLFPTLKKSERDREYKAHQPHQRAEVVYEYLFNGLQHRQLDALLGYDPDVSRGWQSMGILHYVGLVNKHKKHFHNVPLDKAIALMEAEDDTALSDIIAYLRLYSERR